MCCRETILCGSQLVLKFKFIYNRAVSRCTSTKICNKLNKFYFVAFGSRLKFPAKIPLNAVKPLF